MTPGFWVAVLWKRLMGTNVLAVAGDRSGTTRVYAHEDPVARSVGVVVINLDNTSQTVELDFGGASLCGPFFDPVSPCLLETPTRSLERHPTPVLADRTVAV